MAAQEKYFYLYSNHLNLQKMKNVEDLIVESLEDFIDLRCINNVTNPMKNNLVFPENSNGTRRVSEQEARFLFVQAVEQDKQFLYSVEAPTKLSYFFGGPVPVIVQDGQDKRKKAGSIDVCLYDPNGERKHLIEFKALNPEKKAYSKDILKLICDEDNDNLTNYFVQVIENTDIRTIPNIEGKYKEAVKNAQAQAQAQPHSLNQSNLVIFLYVMKTEEIIKYKVDGNGKVITKYEVDGDGKVITKYSDLDDTKGIWTNVVTKPPKN
ncbi:MAG: hypothetical protein MdMp024_0343 [Bacteroidales bacterium]